MRLRPVRTCAALAGIASLSGCGPAHAATRSWQITDVSKLRVEGPFEVHVHVGQPSGVRATGPDDAIDRLQVDQRGDILVIRPQPSSGWSEWPHGVHGKMVVDVNLRALSEAALTGSGDVAIDRVKGDAVALTLNGSGDLSVDALAVDAVKLSLTGSGDLTAAGTARVAAVALTGPGDVHADKLAVPEATVMLSGSGDITLGATRSATVSLSGPGDVSITGPAACTVSSTGSGDVHCAHQSPR